MIALSSGFGVLIKSRDREIGARGQLAGEGGDLGVRSSSRDSRERDLQELAVAFRTFVVQEE